MAYHHNVTTSFIYQAFLQLSLIKTGPDLLGIEGGCLLHVFFGSIFFKAEDFLGFFFMASQKMFPCQNNSNLMFLPKIFSREKNNAEGLI